MSIVLPPECIAFELVPLDYFEHSVASGDGQGGLMATTIIGGELAYQRRLKPVIQAYGLQSNEFGWQFKGEALGFGTTRVAALVRAPKKLKEIGMKSAVIFRGPDSWIAEGGIGSTEPEVHVISF